MCIDIVEIWFGVVNGQILSIFDSYLSATDPYFHFPMITLVNINGFSLNLVCALILWRSALGLLIGKFGQFLTELAARDTSKFLFLVNFTKNSFSPNLCALILWTSTLGLLMVEFCIFLTELSACNTSIFYFQDNT